MPDRRARPWAVAATAAVALALAAVFLLAPPLGTDLSAQVARAGFFARHGVAPVDLGWYGGVSPYGYSLITPPVMSLLGARSTGALAAVVSAVALALLLVRTGARRPLLGGVVGACCIAGNLVSGRVTYAVGVAFGLLALLALTSTRRWLRGGGAVAAAALAAAASPVAGLFTGLAGVALAIGDRRRRADGATIALAAAVPMAAMALLFGDGGWMNISALDAARAGGASLVVALLVPRRTVRVGALLSALGVAAAFALHTPVGLNATRLAAMFALPVLAGYARLPRHRLVRPRPALAVLLAVVALAQPPVSRTDLFGAGDPTAGRRYFSPLLAELARRPAGRVEVVPTANYWEAAYVPEVAPLARGWLRQLDLARNPVFFDGTLDARSYAAWLRENAVAYVAVAAAPPSWVGRREAELIGGGLPYLREVWRDPRWRLYAVIDPTPMVAAPGRLVAADAGGVTLDADRAGDVLVRVRWSRWLTVDGPGACLAPAAGGWTTVRVTRPGRHVVSGRVWPGARCGKVR
ncbi:hypothetical protein SAMN05444365_10556 [Micromonospora pattaloongensis]|uniref:4-amino-4-deoxy-L-arabinose transferase n=1 Tax=Micromonospora pattaloongensis TaxID=405436 RepID=A0A1H3PXK4_9ACTN|nr:hypothetical protein [Micromonospora pattaloongensis]SDZ05119.1 hypothetical protein SAMN05444365_10556 [Micromonospora pattaloongensis]